MSEGEGAPDEQLGVAPLRRKLTRMGKVTDPRTTGRLKVAGVVAATVGVLATMGLNSRFPWLMPTFMGACTRLREAGLGPTADDWFCHTAPLGLTPAPWAASALVTLGPALLGPILVSAGRRRMAFFPLAVFAAVDAGLGFWWGPIEGRSVAARVLAFAILSIPTVAALRWLDPQPSPPVFEGSSPSSRVGATVGCAALLVVGTAPWYLAIESVGLVVAGPLLAMAVFGWLLGPDRRWFPWVVVALAILMSTGPAGMFWHWNRSISGWLYFSAAFPLFVASAIGTAWKPLAVLFASRGRRDRGGLEHQLYLVSTPAARSRVRALNLGSAILLSLSLAGPLLVSWDAPFPTYMGYRERAWEVKTFANLRTAAATLVDYRWRTGGLDGFDYSSGLRNSQLMWTDDRRQLLSQGLGVIWLESVRNGSAQLVARGAEDSMLCMRVSGPGELTYGRSRTTAAGPQAVRSAVKHCGDERWSEELTEPAERPDCSSDEVDNYMICRMVEALMVGMTDFPASSGEVAVPSEPGGYPGRIAGDASYAGDMPADLFVVRHDGGGVTVVDPVSTHRPWGISYLVSWCPDSRTFVDTAHGSIFDEYGRYLAGPAPTGLRTYRVWHKPGEPGTYDVTGLLPGGPRSRGKGPTTACAPRDLASLGFEDTYGYSPPPGDFHPSLVVLSGELVITRDNGVWMCSAGSGGCGGRTPVEGVDTSILGRKWKMRIPGVWRAWVDDEVMRDLVWLGPPPK